MHILLWQIKLKRSKHFCFIYSFTKNTVWGGGGTHVYPWLIHVDTKQKPSRYCKAIIFQLK